MSAGNGKKAPAKKRSTKFAAKKTATLKPAPSAQETAPRPSLEEAARVLREAQEQRAQEFFTRLEALEQEFGLRVVAQAGIGVQPIRPKG